MKKLMLLFICNCGQGVAPPSVPENQCLPVTTCNIDDYQKTGPKGEQGEAGANGAAGKDAGPVYLRSFLECSTIFGEYRFTYTTKLFSENLRFVKCSAMDIFNEYSSMDFDMYSISESGYTSGACILYGVNLDCRDAVGYWLFELVGDTVNARYHDPNSHYDGTVIQFPGAGCIDRAK